MLSGGDPSPSRLSGVTSAARRAVGQWPSGESFAQELLAGLNHAAETESDPDRKSRLREAVAVLGGIARTVVVEVATRAVERQTGMA